jgi:hypothetical protein
VTRLAGSAIPVPRTGIALTEIGERANIMNDTILLSAVGEALYGAQWINDLSRKMCVSDRSMRRWANGTDKIPWGVWHDVYREVDSRLRNLDHWKTELHGRVLITLAERSTDETCDPETDWRFEAHDPESGRHSIVASSTLSSLDEVRAEMKKNPGMIVKITPPKTVKPDEWNEFCKMNLKPLWP